MGSFLRGEKSHRFGNINCEREGRTKVNIWSKRQFPVTSHTKLLRAIFVLKLVHEITLRLFFFKKVI